MVRGGPLTTIDIDLTQWDAMLQSSIELGGAFDIIASEYDLLGDKIQGEFGGWMDEKAQKNTYLWHVYEYGQLGQRDGRLFKLREVKRDARRFDSFIMYEIEFQPATEPIKRPNPNLDGDLRSREHIFKWQAVKLESPPKEGFTIRAKNAKSLVWFDGEGWNKAKEVTTYQQNRGPEGEFTAHFNEFFNEIVRAEMVPEFRRAFESSVQSVMAKTSRIRQFASSGVQIRLRTGKVGTLQFMGGDMVAINVNGRKYGTTTVQEIRDGVGSNVRAKILAEAIREQLGLI